VHWRGDGREPGIEQKGRLRLVCVRAADCGAQLNCETGARRTGKTWRLLGESRRSMGLEPALIPGLRSRERPQ
jgi:hypothetical protein